MVKQQDEEARTEEREQTDTDQRAGGMNETKLQMWRKQGKTVQETRKE